MVFLSFLFYNFSEIKTLSMFILDQFFPNSQIPALPDVLGSFINFFIIIFWLETNIYNAHKYYTRMYIYTVQNNKLTKK